MEILVTGGAGFIGSEFVRQGVKNDLEMIVVDNLTYAGDLKRLKEVEGKYKFYKTDISNQAQIESVFKKEKPGIVINFAAESITKDVYMPVWSFGEIKVLTLEELFIKLARDKRNKIIIDRKGVELINLNSTNYKVLSYEGGIGYWMPIKQISRHKYNGKIIKLIQKWGEIEVTPNHSIYDVNFKLTTPLRNPELLGLRNISHFPKKEKYLNFHGKKLMALLRILGAYISEGWTTYNRKNGCFHIGISNKDEKWISNLKQDLELLNYNPNITKTKDKVFQLMVSNKYLFNFLRKNAGFSSENKFIPSFIFQLKEEFQKEFLKMLVFGDGEIIKNKTYNTIRFTTISRKMATGLSLLLTLLKQNYSVSLDERHNAYNFKIGGDFTIPLLTKKYNETNYNNYVYDISVANLRNFVCGVGNIVVHNTHVDRSIQDASPFVNTNVNGVRVLLDVSEKYNVEKFIHISTDEVYGEIEKGSFNEESPLQPSSPYASSKASADLLIKSYIRTYNFPAIIIRPSNNYGPWQYPEKLIPLVIIKALMNEHIPVYGQGLNIREWLYVEDCNDAIFSIIKKGKIGEVYNIGSGIEKRNIEVVKTILQILNKPEDLIQFVKDRPGHDYRYSLNTEKTEKEIGWKAKFDFESGIEKTVEWYLENKDWLLGKIAFLRDYWGKVYS